jgi:hypothetical protein
MFWWLSVSVHKAVLLQKVTITQPVKKFPASNNTQNFHYHSLNKLRLDPILSQMNEVHASHPISLKIIFNIIFTYLFKSSK